MCFTVSFLFLATLILQIHSITSITNQHHKKYKKEEGSIFIYGTKTYKICLVKRLFFRQTNLRLAPSCPQTFKVVKNMKWTVTPHFLLASFASSSKKKIGGGYRSSIKVKNFFRVGFDQESLSFLLIFFIDFSYEN